MRRADSPERCSPFVRICGRSACRQRGAPLLDEVRLGSRTLQPGRQLLVAGRREPLGKRALDILSVLAKARGEIVTKDELLEAVWPGVVVEENALQVHVVALRKALGPEADRLKTIRGVGYLLDIAADDANIAAQAQVPAQDSAANDPATPLENWDPVRSASALDGLRDWASLNRRGVLATLTVLLLAGAWALFGPPPGSSSSKRVEVVVRELAPSGSGDRIEAALASGITDELIVRLRRMPEMRIGAAEASGRVDGDAFQSAYVIDGNIRSNGDRVRVAARLTNAAGEILWSQTFDRKISDLFEVQEAIAASIADALGVSLDVGANSAAYGGTDKPEAFAAYLEAKSHTFDGDQNVQVRYLERALSIDPGYVKAWAALSTSYGIRSNFAATDQEAQDLLVKMGESTARAVAANPDLWIGHAARGNYYNETRDYAAAAASFRRVAALDKGRDPELREALAIYALLNGHPRQALSLLDSNVTIDPVTRRDPLRVWVLMSLGRYAESIALFDELDQAEQSSVLQYGPHATWAYLLLGREEEGIAFAEEHDVGISALQLYRANPTLPRKSLSELKQWVAQRLGAGRGVEVANVAMMASYDGQPKLAVDAMRLALEQPGGYGVGLLWYPAMANARGTDEFERLVADLGLVRYWRSSGEWPDFCRPVSATEITCT